MTRCVCALGPRVLESAAAATRTSPRRARNASAAVRTRTFRKMSLQRQHSRKSNGCRVVVAALPDEISGLAYVSPASSRTIISASGNPAVSQLALGSRKAAAATVPAKAPAAVVTFPTGSHLVAAVGLFALGSVAACAAAFMVVMAPALKAMERASLATEKASEQMEKAAAEFEKLSVQTNIDLPRTLEEMEKASEEWDALGEELREIIGNVERWGKFSGAEEALTKLTESILEEPSRAIDGARDEAESDLKRLTNDFDRAMGQLSDWERQLKGAVEGWEQSWDENARFIDDGLDGSGDDVDVKARDEMIERRNARRAKVKEALAAAEAATEQAREASRALLSDDSGDDANGGEDAQTKEEKLLEMGKQADEVSQRMKVALLAMEEAKGETNSARDSWK